MSLKCVKPFLAISFLFILPFFSIGLAVCESSSEVAVLAIGGAEVEVSSAYRAVLEAEEAGANVQDLAVRLNNACDLLVWARVLYGVGDFDEAYRLANLCINVGEAVEIEAYNLRDLAFAQREWNFRLTIVLSFVSIGLIVCFSFFGWRVFKGRYVRKVLGMKPEVVLVES